MSDATAHPVCTRPKIVCFPSSHGHGASVRKNCRSSVRASSSRPDAACRAWLPFVFGPELALLRMPAPVCRRSYRREAARCQSWLWLSSSSSRESRLCQLVLELAAVDALAAAPCARRVAALRRERSVSEQMLALSKRESRAQQPLACIMKSAMILWKLRQSVSSASLQRASLTKCRCSSLAAPALRSCGTSVARACDRAWAASFSTPSSERR